MVKIARFSDIPGRNEFTFELDTPVKTVQTDSYYISFFMRIGHLTERLSNDPPINRIRLEGTSTNWAVGEVSMASTSAIYGLSHLYGGTSITDASTMFAGVFGAGGNQQYCSTLREFSSATSVNVYSSAPQLRSNRWIHYIIRFSRGVPSEGWHFNLGKLNITTPTTSSSTFTPQTGIKFSLTVRGDNIHSVQLSNIWAAFEDSVVSDFNDRDYVRNFLTQEGKAIELPGDGAVGAITPVVYFKGENNDPLLDSVSQTQATTNAGNVEVFEKDFSVFSPHPLGTPVHSFAADGTNRELERIRRSAGVEGDIYNAPSSPVDRQSAVSVSLSAGHISVASQAGHDSVPGYRYSTSSASPSNPIATLTTSLRTGNLFGFRARDYNRATISQERIDSVTNSQTARLYRGDATDNVSMAINYRDIPLTSTSGSTVRNATRFWAFANNGFFVFLDGAMITNNPQIDWFGDSTEVLDVFFDRKKRRIREGGLFGELFFGEAPVAYGAPFTDLFYRVGAVSVIYATTTSTPTTKVFAIPEEPRGYDPYGFHFFGQDIQD